MNRDHRLDRKILIGAQENNMLVNNYFDGPFDQLPDNFIAGETLRRAILTVQPDLKGKIDRLGRDPSGEVRFSIDPFKPYLKFEDLYDIHRCATAKLHTRSYYSCFSHMLEGMPQRDGEPAVRAGKRPSGRRRMVDH